MQRRRRARHLFTLCRALSLLLLPFAVGLWVQSYAIGGQLGYRRVKAGSIIKTSLASFGGRLSLSRSGWDGADAAETSGWFVEGRNPRPTYAVDGFAGFEHRKVTAPGRWLWEARVQMWAVAIALPVPPTLQFRNDRRRKHALARGKCSRCGYDLRATPERCPECGASAPTATTRPANAKRWQTKGEPESGWS